MPFRISTFLSLTRPEATEISLTWSEIVTLLSSYKELHSKDAAPGWSPTVFEPSHRSRKNALESSMLVFDIDEDFDRERLKEFPFVFLLHETYTANRWRLVVPLKQPIPAEQYTPAWKVLSARLATLGIQADQACSDPSRFFYVPSKPLGVGRNWSTKGTVYYDPAQAELPSPASSPESAPIDLGALAKGAKDEVRSLLLGKWSAKSGSRDQSIHQVFNSLAQYKPDLNPSVVEHLARLVTANMGDECNPEGREHWETKALSSYERGAAYRKEQLETLQAARDIFVEEAPWRKKLHMIPGPRADDPPRIASDLPNMMLILENDPAFKALRYNTYSLRTEAPGSPIEDLPLDHVSTELVRWFSDSEYRLKVTRENAKSAISRVAYSRKYDPVQEYLEGLKWDGLPRIANVLHDICRVDKGDPELIKEFSLRWFIAGAARGLSPGCQVDSLLVLVGPGGAGKTQFARILGGPFYDSLVGDVTSKDAAMKLAGAWIVEKEELAVSSKSTVEDMRAFITERTTKIRLPYAPDVTAHPRHCVFIATANGAQPIADHEGARRFWPVDVNPFHENLPRLQAMRDQLWAEAVFRFKAGEPWWLDSKSSEAQQAEVQLFQKRDEFYYEIEEWFKKTPQERRPRCERATWYLVNVIGVPASRIDRALEMRIAQSLKVLGFERQRHGQYRETKYLTPEKFLDPNFGKNAENADESLGH